MRGAVLTLSDSGYAGVRKDKSGPLIAEFLQKQGFQVVYMKLLPDGREKLVRELCELCDNNMADLILTTGGTGFSSRDLTPEATEEVIERFTPGIAEAIRWRSLQMTPYAMLSRAIAGIRKKTLIVNLPGSPKAVEECLTFLFPAVTHGINVLRGEVTECAH